MIKIFVFVLQESGTPFVVLQNTFDPPVKRTIPEIPDLTVRLLHMIRGSSLPQLVLDILKLIA